MDVDSFTGLADGDLMASKLSNDKCRRIEKGLVSGPKRAVQSASGVAPKHGAPTAFGRGGCAKAAFQMKVVDPDWAGEEHLAHPIATAPGPQHRPALERRSCTV